jgi:hypothetical protein
VEGYEAWWNQANTRNFPFLQFNAMTAATGSQILPPPTRNSSEPPIGAYVEGINVFTNFIRSTTGVPDAALGNTNPNDRSGKAIEELKIASQQGTSGWLTHHARAIRQTGLVVVDLLPAIYDRPGRVERIIGKDGSEDFVMLNAPFVEGQDGQPMAANGPQMPQQGAQQAPQKPMSHMLAEGQYGVIVNVGKSQQTLKAETFAGMNALAQAAPEMVPRFADLWVQSMDIPNADAIAARIKPPGVDEENGLPPEAQAIVQQMQQQMQELQQLADDNQAKLKIAEMNAQAKMAQSQQDAQLDIQKTQLTEQAKQATAAQADHTKLEIAALQAQTQIAVAELKAGQEETKIILQLMLKKMDLAHDTHMHAEAAQQEVAGKVLDHEIGAHSQEREHQQARETQERTHEQSKELQDRDQAHQFTLAVTPPPEDPNKAVEAP